MSAIPKLPAIVAEVRRLAAERERGADPAALRARAARAERRPLASVLRRDAIAIIAEMKRASPSAGVLRPDLDPRRLAADYAAGGAAALSVLTCPPWFLGSLGDLEAARLAVALPVLAKDFLVTPFQILEAAAAGADAILLIAAALSDAELRQLSDHARTFGMEILFEAHDEHELHRVLDAGATLVGINTRDLRTMALSPGGALDLGPSIPGAVVAVYESGVKHGDDLRAAARAGYRAALVGESLLRAAEPGVALRALRSAGGAA